MRRGVLSFLLLTGMLVTGISTATGAPRKIVPLAPASSAAGTTSFADPGGDAGAAPDITAVTVSNDDEGAITFRITVANRSALGPDDVMLVGIATDDPDFVTGRREDGVNFVVGLDAQGPLLFEWNGSMMKGVTPQPTSLTASFAAGSATITVKQEDLAPGFPDMSVPISFDFFILGRAFSGNEVVGHDGAPDGVDFWSYRLSASPRLILTGFDADKTIKAGQTLVVLLGAAHGDTGAAVASGRITCKARLGTKVLKGVSRFLVVSVTSLANGRTIESPNASCAWRIPKAKARGKTIRGSVSLTERGMIVTRSFSTRIR